MPLKALETEFDGRLYRSRREARWAVFFKVAGIPVQYEEQGYDLGSAGWYLPDFVVNPGTSSELFFEVKGIRPTWDEKAKAEALCEQSKLPVYVYFGPVEQPAPAALARMGEEEYLAGIEQDQIRDLTGAYGMRTWVSDCRPTAMRAFTRKGVGFSREMALWWADCPFCGLVVPKLWGQVGSCPDYADEQPDPLYPNFAHATPRLQDAYAAAAAERFGR